MFIKILATATWIVAAMLSHAVNHFSLSVCYALRRRLVATTAFFTALKMYSSNLNNYFLVRKFAIGKGKKKIERIIEHNAKNSFTFFRNPADIIMTDYNYDVKNF